MKDVVEIVFMVCGAVGVIASLVLAKWPVWVLLEINTRWKKVLWKLLGMFAFGGWMMIGDFLAKGLRLGQEGSVVPFLVLGVVSLLIYLAADRGESLARLRGEIEWNGKKIRKRSNG